MTIISLAFSPRDYKGPLVLIFYPFSTEKKDNKIETLNTVIANLSNMPTLYTTHVIQLMIPKTWFTLSWGILQKPPSLETPDRGILQKPPPQESPNRKGQMSLRLTPHSHKPENNFKH